MPRTRTRVASRSPEAHGPLDGKQRRQEFPKVEQLELLSAEVPEFKKRPPQHWAHVIAESLVPRDHHQDDDPFDDDEYMQSVDAIHAAWDSPCWAFGNYCRYEEQKVTKAKASCAYFSSYVCEACDLEENRSGFQRAMRWASFCTGTWSEGWVPRVFPRTQTRTFEPPQIVHGSGGVLIWFVSKLPRRAL